MDNFEIELLCRSIKELKDHFLGVFPSDKIPDRKNIHGKKFCIANLDPSYKDGSHWVALIFSDNGKDIFFDSYGELPTTSIIKHLKNGFKSNKIQLQHPLSTACGQWCIFFCCAHFSDHSLQCISEHFSQQSDLLVNDYLVNKFVNDILPDDSMYKVIDRNFLKKQIAIARKNVNK